MTREELIELIVENASERMDLDDLIEFYTYKYKEELTDGYTNSDLIDLARQYDDIDEDTEIILED